jgi:hypothetical protein
VSGDISEIRNEELGRLEILGASPRTAGRRALARTRPRWRRASPPLAERLGGPRAVSTRPAIRPRRRRCRALGPRPGPPIGPRAAGKHPGDRPPALARAADTAGAASTPSICVPEDGRSAPRSSSNRVSNSSAPGCSRKPAARGDRPRRDSARPQPPCHERMSCSVVVDTSYRYDARVSARGDSMKIVVIGSSGLIGSRRVEKPGARGATP